MTTARRRPELGAFLRGRRARITPEDVGMPPGTRRRTPGLRREEVAQLAGVGVTWYTWLEQGRPINASGQVLDAVARVLRLDAAEREHLYHLAEVPINGTADGMPPRGKSLCDMQIMLDALHPLPAVVWNARYDFLASNAGYRAILGAVPTDNLLRLLFLDPRRQCPVVVSEADLTSLVSTLRWGYGRHTGEPRWESLIQELVRESPRFARLWANGAVAPPGMRMKLFDHKEAGRIHVRSHSLTVNGLPDARMIVYVPDDEVSRLRLEGLVGAPIPVSPAVDGGCAPLPTAG
ncbi:helix-turn-helix transcriptional regulator [Streptomyces sp. RFCAC02]|uniref:helix-turn-helix transcriptional regulator n=1 Tax=Streptomyces sp. RFCAC02 TaxID=2499143 RepID=UPI0032085AD2